MCTSINKIALYIYQITLKESHRLNVDTLIMFINIFFIKMNVYLFWLLFLSLWAIVPLMIIKGRADESPKMKTSPEVTTKKKGWFK